MGKSIETRQTVTWTCDRCGKVEQVEGKQGELYFDIKDPAGWKALFVSASSKAAFKGLPESMFQPQGEKERKDIWKLPIMELSDGSVFLLCRTCVPISLPFLSVEQQKP